MNQLSKWNLKQLLAWNYQPQIARHTFRRWLSAELNDAAPTAAESPSSKVAEDVSAQPKTEAIRPRASNPFIYQKRFVETIGVAREQNPKIENSNHLKPIATSQLVQPASQQDAKIENTCERKPETNNQLLHPSSSGLVTRLRKLHQRRQSLTQTMSQSGELLVGSQLAKDGSILPKSNWVRVENIPPASSLNAILRGIRQALDIEESRGIVDLDKPWTAGQSIPFLEIVPENGADKWVQKARLILSPFGRPCGWYLKFANRSIVYALLKYARDTPVKCSWRDVRITDYGQPDVDPTTTTPEDANFIFSDEISDNTLRVENVAPRISDVTLLNFFSRYDLRSDPISKWECRTSDGKINPPTYLVHFADAAWARACLREKQATFMQHFPHTKGRKQILLIQYPQQIF
jgi:hypothetical protein